MAMSLSVGAFDAAAAACREMIWAVLRGRGVREDDPVSWPPLAHIDSLGGGLFDAGGRVRGPGRCV